MQQVKVVNIKCGGCEAGIIDSLKKAGAQDVRVDHLTQTVSFEGDRMVMCRKLAQMGYPEASSKEAKSTLKRARSYLSCAIGKLKK